MLGLQLSALDDDDSKSSSDLDEEKAKDTRAVTLVCLKNRNGKAFFTHRFSFTARNNFFKESGVEKHNDDITKIWNKIENFENQEKV